MKNLVTAKKDKQMFGGTGRGGAVLLCFLAFALGVGFAVLWYNAHPTVRSSLPPITVPANGVKPPPPPPPPHSWLGGTIAYAASTNNRFCSGFLGPSTFGDLAFDDANNTEITGIITLWHYNNSSWKLAANPWEKFIGAVSLDGNGSILFAFLTYTDGTQFNMVLTSKFLSVNDSHTLKGWNIAKDNTSYLTTLSCSKNQRS